MAFDPTVYGARCGECWLRTNREGDPVGPELKQGTVALVVVEAPTRDDYKAKRLLAGDSGIELNRALESNALRRDAVSITSAVCCHPDGGDMEKVLKKLQKENKKRAAAEQPALPSPQDCCRPRLHAEMRAMANDDVLDVITLGKGAFRAVARQTASILDIRGGPMTVALLPDGNILQGEAGETDVGTVYRLAVDVVGSADGVQPIRLLPTLDPGMVTKARRWTRAFRADIGRAYRWFTGKLGWEEPWSILRPSAAEVRQFFASLKDEVSYDVETDAKEAMHARLRCIGFSTAEGGIVIPFLSRDGQTRFYTDQEEAELKDLCRELFLRPDIWKIGHNQGSYDQQVVMNHFGVIPAPIIDGLVVHKSVEPELPHNLGYVGSMYTDVMAWKAGHVATEAKTDEELWKYNLTDCVVVARSLPQTLKAAAVRDQEYTIAMDHRVQQICVGLHQNGQLIDQARRQEHDLRLLKEAQRQYVQCVSLAGLKGFNPGSAHQVRDLLFEKWGLSPPPNLSRKKAYTKSGDPSTSDDMILALRTSGFLNDGQRAFLDALRKYRRAAKLRGSYTLPLKPQGSIFVLDDFAQELYDDPETPEEEAAAFFGDRFDKDNKKTGLVWADGRVHGDFNIGPTSGRLSASGGINLQTPPEKLRDMFIPGELPSGEPLVFIYADADQLELRLIAALAQSERYLDIFKKKGDAHAVSASLAFRERFDKLEKDSPDWEALRKFAKILSYASGYGAALDTVLDVIRSVEDDKGNLPYANVSKNEAREIHSNWLTGANIENWWQNNMDTFRKQHFMREPVWGRRRDFLDGENFCEIQNFACQAGGAAIMHEATLQIVDEIPFQKWGPGTGLVNYMHDAVLVAVPQSYADRGIQIVNAAMNRRTPALDVDFTSKAKVKHRWSEPKK